jgi:hypothetical protein
MANPSEERRSFILVFCLHGVSAVNKKAHGIDLLDHLWEQLHILQYGSLVLAEDIEVTNVNFETTKGLQISVELIHVLLEMLQSLHFRSQRVKFAGLLCCSSQLFVLTLQSLDLRMLFRSTVLYRKQLLLCALQCVGQRLPCSIRYYAVARE